MGFEVAAIVLALALLMALAYRGLPVIVFAPICALLAVGLSGRPLLPSYTETFMAAAAGYVRSFFPLFLLGAVFGKLMETSGAAGAIAAVIARTARPAAGDPGRRARLCRADVRRRLAVRGRLRRVPVRGDAVPRGRHPQAARSPAPSRWGRSRSRWMRCRARRRSRT